MFFLCGKTHFRSRLLSHLQSPKLERAIANPKLAQTYVYLASYLVAYLYNTQACRDFVSTFVDWFRGICS